MASGKSVFEGQARAAQRNGETEDTVELSDGEMEDERAGSGRTGNRACRHRGWWKTGSVAASTCPAGMTAWVHRDHIMADQATVENLQQVWECTEDKR